MNSETEAIKKEMARYVLALRGASGETHRAEDRSIYQLYLADASILLALLEIDAPLEEIRQTVKQHERLWGQTWLVDDAYRKPSAVWQAVRKHIEAKAG